jgi:hypothetical protein
LKEEGRIFNDNSVKISAETEAVRVKRDKCREYYNGLVDMTHAQLTATLQRMSRAADAQLTRVMHVLQ